MAIQTVFYLNLVITVLLGAALVILPFVFWRRRKKYLEQKKREF